jgi:hypothetical protein
MLHDGGKGKPRCNLGGRERGIIAITEEEELRLGCLHTYLKPYMYIIYYFRDLSSFFIFIDLR